MKTYLLAPIKAIRFVFSSLAPLAVIVSIAIILGSSLVLYDQTKTRQDKDLGATLIQNLKAESACSQTIKAGEKADASFTFNNQNTSSIALQQIQVENGLLGAGSYKFLEIVDSRPKYSSIGGETNYLNYSFTNTDVAANSTFELTVTFQAASRQTANAKPHTFVVYSGKILFEFEHQITIESPCDIQVVYAE